MTRIRSESDSTSSSSSEIEQDRPPLVALLDHAAVEVLDRPDVEAARRLRGDQHLRIAGDLSRHDDLLLVAAGEPAGAASAARRRGRRTRRSALPRALDEPLGNSQPHFASGAFA